MNTVMEGYSAVLGLAEWIWKVKYTIAQDWLDLIEGSEYLNEKLIDILEELHTRYRPKANGTWNASPRWTEMFSWTSCPVNEVRAVILLKGPNVGKPDKMSDYESNGKACDVRRKGNLQKWQLISYIPTVWNMFQISLLVSAKPSNNKQYNMQLKKEFHNGFNPELLSQRGILFLNVALTGGHNVSGMADAFQENDVRLWQKFTLQILREIPKSNTPLFQWYITSGIKYWLGVFEKNGQYVVSKPYSLCMTKDSPTCNDIHQHICGFPAELLRGYAKELRALKYSQHRDILLEIFTSLVWESKALTYPPPKDFESNNGVKRKYNEEYYQSPKKIKESPRQ